LYANINDLILPGARCDVTNEAEVNAQWLLDERPHDPAVASLRRDMQPKTRPHLRPRTARSHDAAAKHKNDQEPVQATGNGIRPDLKRKPLVAARPPSLTQRRKTCPPDKLNITVIHVENQLPETASSQTVDNSPRTDSRTSASSDVDSGSGDSATSGFSSAGSDVNKATGSSEEHETQTLGRNARRQKPPLKPKR